MTNQILNTERERRVQLNISGLVDSWGCWDVVIDFVSYTRPFQLWLDLQSFWDQDANRYQVSPVFLEGMACIMREMLQPGSSLPCLPPWFDYTVTRVITLKHSATIIILISVLLQFCFPTNESRLPLDKCTKKREDRKLKTTTSITTIINYNRNNSVCMDCAIFNACLSCSPPLKGLNYDIMLFLLRSWGQEKINHGAII